MVKQHRTVVLVAVAGLLGLAAVGLLRRTGAEPIEIATAEVTSGPIVRRIMVTGTLEPMRTVAIGSQVSGTIQSVEVDFNDTVKAGQIVARLDPSLYEARLIEAGAGLAQSRSELVRLRAVADDATTKLDRVEELAADDLVPTAEFDLARLTARDAAAAVKAAVAGVDAARASVAEARVGLNHTIVRSPIDGIVISREVEVGQTVSASVQTPVLFTVADLRQMQLLAEIPESDVGGVRPGSRVSIQVESIAGKTFAGTVSSVRLQPVVEQAIASGQGAGSGTPTPTGTSGTASPPGTPTTPAATSPAGAPVGAAAPPSQPSTATASSAGVVTYTAVIDVNNTEGAVPPVVLRSSI